MRPRLVVPVLAAAGLTVLATWISYGFTTDYGAYDGGLVAQAGAGLYVLWPAVLVIGALAGWLPYLLGERRAARWAGWVMVTLATAGITAGSLWGTSERAAQLPTSPACVAPDDATPAERSSVAELADALGQLDHPARFDAGSADVSADHCQNGFADGVARPWVGHYRMQLEAHGWRVTGGRSYYELLVATRGGLRIRLLDGYGDRGQPGLRIERR